MGVCLGAGRGEVAPDALPLAFRGAETLVYGGLGIQPECQRDRVTFDHQVEVHRIQPEQRIPHRTADQEDTCVTGLGQNRGQDLLPGHESGRPRMVEVSFLIH